MVSPPLHAFTLKWRRLDDLTRAAWRKRSAAAFMSRELDTKGHDLIVALDSSMSLKVVAEITAVMTCDHFSYFAQGVGDANLAFDIALGPIWSQLDLAKVFALLPAAKQSGDVDDSDESFVDVPGVKVTKRTFKIELKPNLGSANET
jgi:hypothetical protein